MYNVPGMKKIISREIYRQKRYGGTLSFAVLSISLKGTKKHGLEELLRTAARTITASLRDADIPAYAGDGVFMILFVELKKKCSEAVLGRLIEKIRRKAGPQLGERAVIKFKVGTWPANNPVKLDAVNDILFAFKKKIL
jgi:PleD family two-component response regulator